jgi:hypothetical protein
MGDTVVAMLALILQENCKAYWQSTDLRESKDRTELIDSVAVQIKGVCQVNGWIVPDNLSKVGVHFLP